MGGQRAAAQAARYPTLRQGAQGPEVYLLQHLLHQEGDLESPPVGVFGPQTRRAVRAFQERNGLLVDGVAGPQTWGHLLQRRRQALGHVPVLASPRPVGELALWTEVQQEFLVGHIATVTDVETGISFQVRRLGGRLHADVEPLTKADTDAMKAVYGAWSWERRAVVVDVAGRRFAGSMNGFPHGVNRLQENGFDGHFCIHFLGSRVHQSDRIDERHLAMTLTAAGHNPS